jgi:hypothetical protein
MSKHLYHSYQLSQSSSSAEPPISFSTHGASSVPQEYRNPAKMRHDSDTRKTGEVRAFLLPHSYPQADPVSLLIPQVDLRGSSLPYELIALIARHLADEGGTDSNFDDFQLKTLGRLSRVSRAVHEVTLPMLYERTKIRDAHTFLRAVGGGNPKGWKWTK